MERGQNDRMATAMAHSAEAPAFGSVAIERILPAIVSGTTKERRFLARQPRNEGPSVLLPLSRRPIVFFPGVPANAQSRKTNNETQLHTIVMEVTALGLIIVASNRRETHPIVPTPKRRRSITKATSL